MSAASSRSIDGRDHLRWVAWFFVLLLVGRVSFLVARSLLGESAPFWGVGRVGFQLVRLSPLFAGLLLAELSGGRRATLALVQRAVAWRAPLHLYALAIGVPLLLLTGGVVASLASGATLNTERVAGLFGFDDFPRFLVYTYAAEVGWRGFALEGFRGGRRYWSAALGLGAATGLLFSLRGATSPGFWIQAPALMLASAGLGLFLAWIYRRAEGSVIPGWLGLSTLLCGSLLPGLLQGSGAEFYAGVLVVSVFLAFAFVASRVFGRLRRQGLGSRS